MGLVSVGVTWDQGFNGVRIPESSTLMGAENTWILVPSWGGVWKSLGSGFRI